MTLAELRRSSRNTIIATAARHGASNVRVFGPVARGEASDRSDVDLLVDLDRGRSLMDLGGILTDLLRIVGEACASYPDPAWGKAAWLRW